MTVVNQEVRLYAKGRGIFLWEIGQEMGVSENTIIRRLRKPLPLEEEQKYIDTIDQIARRKAGKA